MFGTVGTNGIVRNPIGLYWYHNYNYGLTVLSSEVKLTRADGQTFNYNPGSVSGTWVSDADVNYRLEETLAAGVRTGWTVTTPDGTTETYSPIGDLLAITDRSGLSQTLTYSCTTVSATCPVPTPSTVAPVAGFLTNVTDNFGNSLNFTYNNLGQIVTMADPANNVTSYGYDADGNLSTVTYPDDTPTVSTDNPQKTYVYGNDTNELGNTANVSQPHALTGITDENGLRYATYKYGADGKAISTEHAGAVEKYSLAYAPDGSSTAVTDPLGTIRTTHFTTVLGVVKPTGSDQPGGSGCLAASSAITYDTNGNVASRTDFNGHKTCFAHDLSRNLETARVEGLPAAADCAVYLAAASLPAPVRKTSTQWHGTYRLPLKIAGPNKLTTYTYDGSGNRLSHKEQATTDATGAAGLSPTASGIPRTWAYTYNGFGQTLTANGPRNDATDAVDKTTYTYYPDTHANVGARGNLATVKNALGQTTTLSNYDGNGRARTITAPNGAVTTLDYTPRGWLNTHTVTGGGTAETTGYTYDPTGLLKTTTPPDGSTLTYTYDAAHRLTDIEDKIGNKAHYTLDNNGNRTNEQYTDPSGALKRNIDRAYDALNRLQTITGASQ